MDVFTNFIGVIFCNMYTYQSVTLYTLNSRNVICQLYLNKAGGGNTKKKKKKKKKKAFNPKEEKKNIIG